jgi:uncharacterized membrane protein YkgB
MASKRKQKGFHITERHADLYARAAIFIIFFWFGALKLFMLSPADEIVESLLSVTIPDLPFEQFFIFLGLVEMLIGALFLIPKLTKYVLPILLLHMLTTFGPLLLIPEAVWNAPFVPTIEGQYIIKNLALVALALSVYVDAVHIKPRRKKK